MADIPDLNINDHWIQSKRGIKNPVDPSKPYEYLVEKECNSDGIVEDVATIFLTNSECPFHCLMCDLWKNTTEGSIPPGAIPDQIRHALDHLPQASTIKLYNSGNFFDTRAIPENDYPAIASLVETFDFVIVESHPKLINNRSLEFRDLLDGNLEIAVGLETVHPEILFALNKRMDLDDFKKSIGFLNNEGIPTRAFILLNVPFLSIGESIYWAKRSIDFAFESRVECCTIIPTRTGNGALDWLKKNGHFIKPSIYALEEVLEYGLQLKAGRVFADLWDIEQFSVCENCLEKRTHRVSKMNLNQKILPRVHCSCNQS